MTFIGFSQKQKWIFALMFWTICTPTLAATVPQNGSTGRLERLLTAIRSVETGNNDKAIGDKGKALGSFQIHEIYWKDAVQYDKVIGGKYTDVTNYAYAKKIVLAYFDRYGKGKSCYELCQIHNGGPNGIKVTATKAYADRVHARYIKLFGFDDW